MKADNDIDALIVDRRGEAMTPCNGICGEMFFPEQLADYEERGQLCAECVETTRPRLVKCSYPGCDRMTTYEEPYGDLCYRHIRAEDD